MVQMPAGRCTDGRRTCDCPPSGEGAGDVSRDAAASDSGCLRVYGRHRRLARYASSQWVQVPAGTPPCPSGDRRSSPPSDTG